MEHHGLVFERPPGERVRNVLIPAHVEFGSGWKGAARIVSVESPFTIEHQPVAPGGTPIVESEAFVRAEHEFGGRPGSLMPADIPPALKAAVLEVFTQDHVRIRIAAAWTRWIDRGGRAAGDTSAAPQHPHREGVHEQITKTHGAHTVTR